MASSNKSIVFRFLRSMVKKRSLTGIDRVIESFDNSLTDSLKWSEPIILHLNQVNIGYFLRSQNSGTCTLPSHDPIRDLNKRSDIDLLKPFDIVVALQVISLYSAKRKSLLIDTSEDILYRCRLHSVLILILAQLEFFSFVKLSLVLNSLANIINSSNPSLVNIKNGKQNEHMLFTSPNGIPHLDYICNRIGDHSLEDSLVRLNGAIQFRLKHLLLSSFKNTQPAKENEIDMHGMCMVLKYYSIFKTIDPELLYLMYVYVSRVQSISVLNKINMLLSLNRIALFSGDNFRMFNDEMYYNEYNDIILKYKDIDNQNIFKMIVSSLILLPTSGTFTLEQSNSYLKILLTLYMRGLCDNVNNVIVEHLQHVNDIDCSGGIEHFISLLHTLHSAFIELNIDFKLIKDFFFSKRNYEIVLLYLLNYYDQPSMKSLSKLSTFLNGIKMNVRHLDKNELNMYNGLLKSIESVVPVMLNRSNDRVNIPDILSLRTFSNSDKELLNRIFSIYSNAATYMDQYNPTLLLKHTNELMLYSYNNHWNLGDNLHCVISQFICDSYPDFVKRDCKILLKLLRTLSKMKLGVNLIDLYKVDKILSDICNNVEINLYASFLIDIIYNIVSNNHLKINDITYISDLSLLFNEFYSNNVEPMLISSNQKTTDISLFSKYVYLSWSAKDISIALSQNWSRCLDVLLNSIHHFKSNIIINEDCVKDSHLNWQSFSANIVISILTEPIIINNHQLKVKAAISFVLTMLSHFYDKFVDNSASVIKLKQLINDNTDVLPCDKLYILTQKMESQDTFKKTICC